MSSLDLLVESDEDEDVDEDEDDSLNKKYTLYRPRCKNTVQSHGIT